MRMPYRYSSGFASSSHVGSTVSARERDGIRRVTKIQHPAVADSPCGLAVHNPICGNFYHWQASTFTPQGSKSVSAFGCTVDYRKITNLRPQFVETLSYKIVVVEIAAAVTQYPMANAHSVPTPEQNAASPPPDVTSCAQANCAGSRSLPVYRQPAALTSRLTNWAIHWPT